LLIHLIEHRLSSTRRSMPIINIPQNLAASSIAF
jgi:hypothetical protein